MVTEWCGHIMPRVLKGTCVHVYYTLPTTLQEQYTHSEVHGSEFATHKDKHDKSIQCNGI